MGIYLGSLGSKVKIIIGCHDNEVDVILVNPPSKLKIGMG